ncbi:unnamed protein product [Lathyrus oleraceus]
MGRTDEGVENGTYKKSKWITKLPYFVILFTSIFTSIVGGCVLGWWLHKYHPTNKQLWMVPFGFVLFFTPLIVLLSLIVSDPCFSKQVEDSFSNTMK